MIREVFCELSPFSSKQNKSAAESLPADSADGQQQQLTPAVYQSYQML